MYTGRFAVLLVLILLVSCVSINNALSDVNSFIHSLAKRTEGKESTAQAKNDQTRRYAGQEPLGSMSPRWKKEIVDTTAGVEYLIDIERQVIIEINMVRTDPAEYARSFLVPLRSYYRNLLLQYPGEIAILTNEGIRALDECIKELQVTKPLSSLSPKKGLTLAARDQARDQATTGATGHTGSDKSNFADRLNRYGKWDISAGENIDYGNGDARRIVTSLLIDDGVTSRWHRINLLDGSFKFVGVSVGPHNVYRHMCVMDLRDHTGKQVASEWPGHQFYTAIYALMAIWYRRFCLARQMPVVTRGILARVLELKGISELDKSAVAYKESLEDSSCLGGGKHKTAAAGQRRSALR